MALWLSGINGRGLNLEVSLAGDLQRPGVNVCCIQEIRFSTSDREYILVFPLFSML